MQLKDKVIVVTGAGGVIGSAVARLAAGRGARLVLVDRDDATLASASTHIQALGAPVIALCADVTREPEMAEVVARGVEAFGGVHGWVNNVGIEGPLGAIPDYSVEAFDTVMATNVRSCFLGLKYAIPAIAATGGGSVVNLGSTSGLIGNPDAVAYVASKHAVIGLTRAAAAEWGHARVRVNCVAPGPIESPMMAAFEREEAGASVRDWYEKHTPLGRFGAADEPAELILFLLSDAARFMTGGVYVVDGGLTAVGRPRRASG